MAVSVDELPNSPQYKFGDGILTVTRYVLIDWDDITAYMEELTPAVQQVGSDSLHQLGQAFPGNSNLRVRSFHITPFHEQEAGRVGVDANGLLAHDHAMVTIEYATPDAAAALENEEHEISIDPVPFLSHQMASGGSFLQVKATGFKWHQSGLAIPTNVPVGVFVSTTQHKVVWHQVPFPNWAALETAKGKVNDASFILRGFSYPFETLLYLGYDAKQDVMSDGARAWEVTTTFESKMVAAEDAATILSELNKNITVTVSGTDFDIGGHNHFWDEDSSTPGFYRIKRSANTNGIYKSYDFNQFFTQEQD